MAATMTSSSKNNTPPTPEKVKKLLSSFLAPTEKTQTVSTARRSPKASGKSPVSSRRPSDQNAQDPQARTNALRSYDSYLQRLDSFSSLTWFGKPKELNPLICARYGWENVDTDMLQCVACKAFLCGKLPDQTNSDLYAESLSKLKKNLLSAHDKFCALAVNPCSESYCRVPLDEPANLTSDFADRVSGLGEIQERLPAVDYSDLNQLGYDEGQGAAYCKKHLLPDSDASPQAVALAFCGWTYSSQNVLICCMCRRQVGLWNYSQDAGRGGGGPDPDSDSGTNDSDKDEDGESEQPKAKRRRIKVSKKQKFDPIEEHRHWCPWITETEDVFSSPQPQGQASPPSQRQKFPAFIISIKTIAPGLMDNNTGLAHAMKTSPMVDGLRCFRRVMKSWSSPKSTSPGSSPTKS